MADLGAIDEDVPFDFGAADALIASADAAAGDVEGQAGSRNVFVTVALTEFKGHFSDLFRTNAATARADATELGERLREIASGARTLKEEARKEQQRRETARQWKAEQDDRNLWDKGVDSVFGGDAPPVGPPAGQVSLPVSPPRNAPRQTPAPGSGGGGSGGTSSAKPEDLRSFATGSSHANSRLTAPLSRARSDYATFCSTCHWGTLSADGVFTGADKFLAANEQDVAWANTVAGAFEAAGGSGAVSTLSNSALAAALQAAGVSATRQDIVIDPPSAYGHPPTTGYADDPVNTSTGNFLESEADLGFAGACGALVFSRTYNSLNDTAGALGLGWSSWTEAGLRFDDEAAHLVLPDGRQVTFARLGAGWDRAVGESLWLERTDDGLQVRGNDGTRWSFTTAGRLVERSSGPGSAVRLEWSGDRLTRMSHERGRAIELLWGETRLIGLRASDGREVSFGYDEQERLVSSTSALGVRRYRWDDQGRIDAVLGASGVAEVENAYDDRGRVIRQRSAQGRVTRYVYLPGRVTVVSDEDGTRSNTWIADERGRLVGLVDADECRLSTSYDTHGNPVMVTERDGAVTVKEYDGRGRLVGWVDPSGARYTQDWDDLDRLSAITVDTGADEPAVTAFTYDGDERNPATLTDPEGGRTQMTWDNGLLTEVVDPTGVVVGFTHDEHGDLVATTDAAGNAARLERDASGRVVAAVTPSGHRTSYRYDTVTGLLKGRTDPGGGTWAYEHTEAGLLAATIDPAGGRTEVQHAPDGQVATTVDALGRAVTRHFDDLGNVASVELPDGATWRFSHDGLSRLRETTDPTGATWTRDYDVNGTLTSTTSPTGERRSATTDRSAGTAEVHAGPVTAGIRFDQLGRLVASERPDGSTVLTRYDRCGRPAELIDAAGGLTSVERDAAGRPVAVTKPGGGTVTYTYDACGRPDAVVDELGARTTMTYDADGRLVVQTMPSGEQATWAYDADGRVTKRRVPGSGTTLLTYDPAGRVVESRDPQFGHRRFRYDAAGQLVEAVDGNGGSTRWEYDANGRAVTTTDPAGGVVRREFDALNHVVAKTDPLGRTTRAGYDAAGRQVWQEDPTGKRTVWTYDATGRLLTTAVDGEVVSSVDHDVRGRRVRVVDHTGAGREAVHELVWDTRGNLVSRTRDGRGLSWTYDADGRRASRTGPDGSTTRYDRDAAGRISSVVHDTLGRAAFERDVVGRVVGTQAYDASGMPGLAQTWTFGDGRVAGHQVTIGDRTSITVVDRDDEGRVVTVARDGVATSLVHDEAHQLVEARRGDVVSHWRYDAAGRLVAETRDGVTRTLSYDAAGQLVSTDEPDGRTVAYSYDGAGRRTRVEGSDGATRDFAWSRLGWLSAVSDRDATGQQVRTVTTAVDALGELARLDDAEVFFDTADRRAVAPAQVGDDPVVAAGPVTGVGHDWTAPGWRQARTDDEDPWAAAGGPSGGIAVGGAGEVTIAGLEWMGARVYDPSSRGFLSVDPWQPVPGAAWAGNPYSYAGNDPLNAVDPTGLRPVTDAELAAYTASHQGALHAAGEWMGDNWEYVAGGAMVIAGGALMVTGVGGPAGMMLMSAGADTIIQKATTGEVNWGQVAISGAFGAWGGAGAAARMGVSSALGKAVVGGALSGATSGAVGSTYTYATGPGPHTPGGFVTSAAQGGAMGGVTGGVLGGAGHGLEGIADQRLANAMADGRLGAEPPVPTLGQEARSYLGEPGSTVVLGRQPDTAVAADWPDHVVLQAPDGTWSPEFNDEFIQGAMDYQRPLYLASEPEGNLIQTQGDHIGEPTVFARELDQLDVAGYQRSGDYMELP